jgi:metal-dependent amidase/aminoacylase/carboxypeptidase family protein
MDALSLRCRDVTFLGESAHAAAAPWKGHSALAAARKFLDLIDARRECFTPDIRVNGVILEGGKAPNILPDRAELRVEFRAESMAGLERVDEIVVKCSEAAALALDCTVTRRPTYPDFADMVRVPALENEITALLAGLGQKVSKVAPPTGSSDMGNVSYRCPAIQPMIAITGESLALHTQEFAAATRKPAAHEALAVGAEALVLLSLKLLRDEDFRREVRDGWLLCRERKLKGASE